VTKLVGFTILLALVLNITSWVVAFWFFPRTSSTAVLHYTSGVGIDLIGEGSKIILLPLTGTLLISGHLVVGYIIKSSAASAAWLLWGILPFHQAILLTTIIFLQRLNI